MADKEEITAGQNNGINGNRSGFYFMALLYRHKWFILSMTILSLAVSLVIALNMPLWYASTVSVVPPKVSDNMLMSSMSGLSSTLKEVGLTRFGGGSSDSYSFTVILNSRAVMDSMINKYELDKVYDIPKTQMKKLRDAFTDNCLVTSEKEGNYTVTIWDTDKRRAAEMANDYIRIANDVAVRIFRDEMNLNVTQFQERIQSTDSTLKALGDSLGRLSKKYLLFSPQEQAKAVSQAMSEVKAEEAKSDVMYEVFKKAYGENDPYTQLQKDIRNQTTRKSSEIQNMPGYAGNFSVKNAGSISIEYMKLLAEFETFTKVKAMLLPTIEKAKLDETKKLENLFVLDRAEPATEKDRPKRSVIVAGSTLGGFIFAILMIVLINSVRSFKEQYQIYAENAFKNGK